MANNYKKKSIHDHKKQLVARVQASHPELPKGVAEGVVLDLARIPDVSGKKLSKREIAQKWGLASETVEEADASLRGDYAQLRSSGFNKCMILSGLMAQELLERMQDPEQRKLIPADKLPKMMRDSYDAAVLLKDGHQPAVSFNIGDMRRASEVAKETIANIKNLK